MLTSEPDASSIGEISGLREALTSLLRRKRYDQITVQDILEEADVGRSTFYSHCNGKEDLLRRGLQMLRTELRDAAPTPVLAGDEHGFAFSLRLLEHIADHRKVYPSISRGRGRDVLFQEMRSVVLNLLREELAGVACEPSMPRELTEELIAGAFMSLVVFWLEHKTQYTPAQVDALFQRFVRQGLGEQCAARGFATTVRT